MGTPTYRPHLYRHPYLWTPFLCTSCLWILLHVHSASMHPSLCTHLYVHPASLSISMHTPAHPIYPLPPSLPYHCSQGLHLPQEYGDGQEGEGGMRREQPWVQALLPYTRSATGPWCRPWQPPLPTFRQPGAFTKHSPILPFPSLPMLPSLFPGLSLLPCPLWWAKAVTL